MYFVVVTLFGCLTEDVQNEFETRQLFFTLLKEEKLLCALNLS